MDTPSLRWLPISMATLTVLTFIATYIMSVLNHHVWPVFPYISDTGTTVPESCVFGLGLTISAFLALWTMYVRYKLVDAFESGDSRINRLNYVSLILATLSSLGLILVANFQETSVEAVHIAGAAMVFGFGCVYALMHTIISYRMHPMYNGLRVCHVRLALTLVSTISFVIVILAGGISRYQYDNGSHPDSKTEWQPQDSGYVAHIVSTVAEWLMGIAFQFFFLTYSRDFDKLSLRMNTQLYVSHLDEQPFVSRSQTSSTPLPSASSGLPLSRSSESTRLLVQV